MSKYNYYEAVHDDIVTAIFDNYSNEQIVINLRNNEEKFKEMLYDDLFFEALDNFGDSFNHYIYGNTLDFEKIDVVIRCYVLRHTINVVVDELKEQFKEEL